MSRYDSKTQKSRREKIGFYTALTICLIAICMAVYSTYSTVTEPSETAAVSAAKSGVAAVNDPATRGTVPVPTLGIHASAEATEPPETTVPEPVTEPPEPTEVSAATVPAVTQGREDALQTMLAANVSLTMPTKSGHVMRGYSRDSVYNKTLNTWKPHTGVDFDGDLGEPVVSMLSGEVTKIYDDKMLGKTVEITVNNVTLCYSGMGQVRVSQGDKLERGDKIGTIGAVPSEAEDPVHIHVAVKVNNTYADPLSFINNE